MNYQTIYDSLIEKRKLNRLTKNDGYFETHHEIPKALGGTDDQTNLVNLTAREHFIAHLLLERITKQKYGQESKEHLSMAYAIFKMAGMERYAHYNSRIYEMIRQEFRQTISKKMKGMKRGPMSDEQKELRRKDASNRIWVNNSETKECHFIRREELKKYEEQGYVVGRIVWWSSNKGKKLVLTDEQRKRRSEAHKGKRNAMYGKTLKDFMTEEEYANWCKSLRGKPAWNKKQH